MKRILTVGAYERDNFGDGLYQLLAQRMFSGHLVRAAAVMFADMRPYFGELVFPYHHLLTRHRWDLVYVVGGELGAVDTEHAMRMALSKPQEQLFLRMTDKQPAYRMFACCPDNGIAYLPHPDDFAPNIGTRLCVNSVGLSRLGQIGRHTLAVNSPTVLRRANYLAVRDHASVDYLKTIGVTASLAPDSAHAIGHYLGADLAQPPSDVGSRYLAFQANEELIDAWGDASIVQALAAVASRFDLEIRFVAAGVASYHDSYAQYLRLSALLARKSNLRVSIAYQRDPLTIARYIKHASLWVGSSLHGRIVAAAASVPRIGLRNAKLSAYAQQWDEEFPIDVEVADLEDAARKAMADPLPRHEERARWLEGETLDNNRRILEENL